MRTPLYDGWSVRAPQGPFEGVAGSAEPPRAVTLPHDALRDAVRAPDVPSAGATAYHPPGAFSYLRTLEVPEHWRDRQVTLEIEGAYRHASVFVDDELAGQWADGYSRFLVPLDAFLTYGRPNVIRVEVRTYLDSRWYSGAGLMRGVHLLVQPLVNLDPNGTRIRTLHVDDEGADIEVAVRVRNATRQTRTVTLRTKLDAADSVRVDGDDTLVTVPPGEALVARQRLWVPQARLWSAQDPYLYTLGLQLHEEGVDGIERLSLPVGIRTLRVDPRHGLRVNGEPVKLRGACVHHDNGPLGGAAPARAEERRVELLKAAGFNAIRASHNQLSTAMLEACDRVGMLVMNESFDAWTRFKKPWDHAWDFPEWWERDLAAMIDSSANHPSVVLYSLGNEIVEVGTPRGAVWARRLAERLRELDPTRPLTHGVNMALAVLDEVGSGDTDTGGLNDMGDVMNVLGSGASAGRRTVQAHSVVDVAGFNYAEDRYAPDRAEFPHRVVVGSETFPSRIAALWKLVQEHPHVIGDFTWTGWDYLGEVGIGATAYADDAGATPALEREFPYLTAWCGDLDITGFRRPISYYREIVFGLRTEPYIAVQDPRHHGREVAMRSPWGWSDSLASWTWPGFEGRPVVVEVYADAEQVELLLDGRSLGTFPVGRRLGMLAECETTWQPGELVAVARRDGQEVGRTCLRSTTGVVGLTAAADRERVRADHTDLAYVEVELRDASGTLDASRDVAVTVAVDGPGELAGFCSADPSTDERFDAATRTTFRGRALAVVRPTGPGAITVHLSSEAGDSQVHITATWPHPTSETLRSHGNAPPTSETLRSRRIAPPTSETLRSRGNGSDRQGVARPPLTLRVSPTT